MDGMLTKADNRYIQLQEEYIKDEQRYARPRRFERFE